MRVRTSLKALSAVLILLGLWAPLCLALLPLGLLAIGEDSERLLPFSLVISLITTASGVVLLFRQKLGLAAAIFTQVPQAVSFAVGSVAYVLHLGPQVTFEVSVPGPGGQSVGTYWYGLSYLPELGLHTERNYVGFGVGFNLLAVGLLFWLLWALLASFRVRTAPN